jgi:hypothetical protein
MTNMSSLLIGKTVTPFLKEHIPSLYAPIGKPNNEQTAREKNPNTKYCYRHRPDSKCRRAADEAKMVMIQQELDKLTPAVGWTLRPGSRSISSADLVSRTNKPSLMCGRCSPPPRLATAS